MFQDFALTYTPYGEGAKRAASLQAFKADWTKYKVTITDQRLKSGNYLMACVRPPTRSGAGCWGCAAGLRRPARAQHRVGLPQRQ